VGRASRCGAPARTLALAAALAGALTLGAAVPAVAGGKGDPKLPPGKQIKVSDPCTLLDRDQVRALFTSVVIRNRTNDGSPVHDCAWILKASGEQTGRVVGAIVFPGFTPPNVNAIDVVEDDRASAQLAGPGVVEIPFGRAGFLDKNNARFEVAPSRRFAFSLQLLDAAGAPRVLTAKERSRLTTLVADVVKRGKTVS
jgi:hypothetical protein